MKKHALLVVTAVVGGTVAFQGSVNLQATTPGTPQTGHLNITGTAKAGSMVGYSTTPTGQTFGGDFRAASNEGRALLGNASSTTGATYGGLFQNFSNAGRGVAGIAQNSSGTTYGGFFSSLSNQGRGLYGQATSATGTTYGVYGKAVSPSGFGVFSEGNMHATGVISGDGPLVLTGSEVWTIQASTSNGAFFATAVQGIAHSTAATNVGVSGESKSPSGIGVFALASATSGLNYGVHGMTNSQTGRGVYGHAPATFGLNYGVYGRTDSVLGVGIFGQGGPGSAVTYGGWFDGLGGTGVRAIGNAYGVFASSAGGPGVLSQGGTVGVSATGGSMGISALANTASGLTYGGRFESLSPDGRGVFGYASSASGVSFGIQGLSNSSQGYAGHFTGVGPDAVSITNTGTGRGATVVSASDTAIWGLTTSGFAGIDGRNASATGYALFGRATSTSGANYGAIGQSDSAAGFGVYSIGNMGASGTKPFRIDHPFDPENKYLLHYAAESPMPQNFYSGNITTDAKGYAWVELPDYFAEINTNFKYQLTVVSRGKDFVQAMVSEEIQLPPIPKEGVSVQPGIISIGFQIRTSAPNTKVSWRVEADRNDLYVRNRPPKVEIDKEGRERGTYQHPELYGLGPERGMNYDPERARKLTKPSPEASRSKAKAK